MWTIVQRFNGWATEELRWASQVNKSVWLSWYNKWLLIFQKALLEFVSGKQSTSVTFQDITKDVDQYRLPEYDSVNNIQDFYSIVQLRVAYHTDKNDNPIYRVCKPIDFWDYNISPLTNKWNGNDLEARWGVQKWWPYIWDRISEATPRYIFVPKLENWVWHNDIKIFPTPTEDVENWLTLTYNFIQQPISYAEAFPANDANSLDEWALNLPRYFFDAIEDYITFRLYQAENPEMAQRYYQQFEQTLHDNIYGLNKDKRPIEEGFADTRYFSHY